jgi:oligopeptide transport system substrate-binding protein
MKRIIGATLSLVTAFSLTACGNSGSKAESFNYALNSDISSLDTSAVDEEGSIVVLKQSIEGLMVNDANGNTIPGMAKKIKKSKNGLTYTFTLRDAKWSNGDQVKAEDFVYAWQRIFKEAGSYEYMFGSSAANIKNADALSAKQEAGKKLTQKDLNSLGIKAKDDHTVVVNLEKKVAFFEQLMTFTCFRPIDASFAKKQGKSYGKSVKSFVSNGPFKVTSWTKGSKIVLAKNKDYYDANKVELDNLTIHLAQDAKSAASAFENGTVDLFHVDSSLVSKYKKKAGYFTYNTGFEYYLSLNLKNKALANKNIRYALSYAINKKDFADNILGDGSSAAKGFVLSDLANSPSGKEFRSQAGNWQTLSYNQQKAQEYLNKGLKELGKKSITLDVLYGSDEETMKQLATFVQFSLKKLKGIKINVTATVKEDRTGNKMPNGEYDIACTRWGPDYQDPTTFLNLLTKGNQNNFGKYDSKAYNKQMNIVKNSDNMTTRWNAMIKADQILSQDLPIIPVYEKAGAMMMNKDYTGFINKPVIGTIFKYVHKK